MCMRVAAFLVLCISYSGRVRIPFQCLVALLLLLFLTNSDALYVLTGVRQATMLRVIACFYPLLCVFVFSYS